MFLSCAPKQPRDCCNKGLPSKTHLKPKSRQMSFAHTLLFRCQIVSKFAPSTAVQLPCSVQICKTVWQMKWASWAHEFSRDLSWMRFEFRADIQIALAPVEEVRCVTPHIRSLYKKPGWVVTIITVHAYVLSEQCTILHETFPILNFNFSHDELYRWLFLTLFTKIIFVLSITMTS